MSMKPLDPFGNGDCRDSRGRFARGNPGGPGNPRARQVAQLREALVGAVSATDLRAIVRTLVKQARDGDVVSAREVLDRVLGKPASSEVLARLEALEAKLGITAEQTADQGDDSDGEHRTTDCAN